jgi:hypothetical protein
MPAVCPLHSGLMTRCGHHCLFDPLEREAIYQFLISPNLHVFETIMGKDQSCLVGWSSYD